MSNRPDSVYTQLTPGAILVLSCCDARRRRESMGRSCVTDVSCFAVMNERVDMFAPKMPVTSAEEVRAMFGEPMPNQLKKVIDHIDVHCRAWIERSPFIVITSSDAHGNMDISPKGDPAGFVKVLDPATLAIPDRLGNRRIDTFLNILQNPTVGILFVVPKRREVVRVTGVASLARDPDLLRMLAVNDKEPNIAMIVRVKEAFFHCGKSMIRSGMWEPQKWGSIEGLPSYAQALMDHAATDSLDVLQEIVERNERERLY